MTNTTQQAQTLTLGELIEAISEEGPVSPCVEALMAHAERSDAMLRTCGIMLNNQGRAAIPVGVVELAGTS